MAEPDEVILTKDFGWGHYKFIYHAIEHGGVLFFELDGSLVPLLEVQQGHKLRVLGPEVIFG
jgi:hypothetical protein